MNRKVTYLIRLIETYLELVNKLTLNILRMIQEHLLDCIECAIGHKCAKDESRPCAYCEIGFHFIAENPIQLTCGHTICKRCSTEYDRKVECKTHGETSIGFEAISANELIKIKASDLFSTLKETFSRAIDLLQGKAVDFLK